MRFIFRVLLITLIAFGLAYLARVSHSHIIAFIGNYRLDMSLTALVLFILAGFATIYYTIRLVVNVNRLPNKLNRWHKANVINRSRKYLLSAAVHYFEGKYGSAHRDAMQSINKEVPKDSQFMALLLAFKSSGFMRRYDREEALLTELDTFRDKKWVLAKLMTKAESDYVEQRYSQCLDNANQVLILDRKHIPAHRLMLKTFLHLKNYDKAYSVLNWLIRHDYLESYKAQNYKIRVLSGLFATITDVAELSRVYKKLDVDDRMDPLIFKFYLDGLIRLQEYQTASSILVGWKTLDLSYGIIDSILLLAKRLTEPRDQKALLEFLVKLLAGNSKNAKLFLSLGILSCSLGFYVEARAHLEAGLSISPSILGYMYLTIVAKNLNDTKLNDYAMGMLVDNIRFLT